MSLYAIAGVLTIIASVLLTFVVLIQNSKGGGLSSAFGASNVTNIVGTRRAAQDIEKITWYLGMGLMVLAFVANIGIGGEVTQDDGFGKILENPTAAPAMPTVSPAGQSGPAVNAPATQPGDNGGN